MTRRHNLDNEAIEQRRNPFCPKCSSFALIASRLVSYDVIKVPASDGGGKPIASALGRTQKGVGGYAHSSRVPSLLAASSPAPPSARSSPSPDRPLSSHASVLNLPLRLS